MAATSRPSPLSPPLHAVRSAGTRVCPKPAAWRAIHELLLSHQPHDALPPPRPYAGILWHLTTDGQKEQRWREQIEWAIANRVLKPLRDHLMTLDESDWHHW